MILKVQLVACGWQATLSAEYPDPEVARMAIYRAAIKLHLVQHADCQAMEDYLKQRCGYCWPDGIPRPECEHEVHFDYPPPEHAP